MAPTLPSAGTILSRSLSHFPHALRRTAVVIPRATAYAIFAVEEVLELLQQATNAADDDDIAEFAEAYCELEELLKNGTLSDAGITVNDLFPAPAPAPVAT